MMHMKSKMIYLTITLETAGPVFIGNGEEYQKSEYLIDTDNNIFYLMDTLKLFNGLKKLDLLKTYESWILSEPKNVNLYYFISENGITEHDYSQWAVYSYNIHNANDLKSSRIYPFIKDPYNLPYIPGSSLKGSIRNAILNSELLNSNKMRSTADSAERSAFSFVKRNQYLSGEARSIDTELFHTLNRTDAKGRPVPQWNAANSIFKGFRISDSRPLPVTALGLFPKKDQKPDGSTVTLPFIRECIRPGTRIEFDAVIDPDIFPYNASQISKAVSDMYENEQNKFMSAFPKLSKPGGNMLYMGGGSGFITKTAVYSLFKERSRAVKVASVILDNIDSKVDGIKVGNHLKDPLRYTVSPHTRKLTKYMDNDYEFALCKIEIKNK